MLILSWLNADRTLEVRVPISESDEKQLGEKLGAGDWQAEEALYALAEALAGSAARFARARSVPPTQHAVASAVRAIVSKPVQIPDAAMRDRAAMARFLKAEGVRDADCSSAVILHGRPAQKTLPLPQSPYVMRKLTRAGYVVASGKSRAPPATAPVSRGNSKRRTRAAGDS